MKFIVTIDVPDRVIKRCLDSALGCVADDYCDPSEVMDDFIDAVLQDNRYDDIVSDSVNSEIISRLNETYTGEIEERIPQIVKEYNRGE